MAKVMAFSTRDGVDHAQAYWRIAQINIGVADKSARIEFLGYHSKAAYNNGAAPIANKSFDLSGPRFEKWLAVLVKPQVNALSIAYAIAVEKGDDVPEADRDFFAAATDDV